METNRRITQILDLENTYLKVAIITTNKYLRDNMKM